MISHRIQYELEKQELEATEIMLGTWIFDEFIKEREAEELQKFDDLEDFTFLGIRVTQSNILNPTEIKIYRKDQFGLNKLNHSLHDFIQATKIFSETAAMFSPLAIVTRRFTNEPDFNANYLLLNEIPKNQYKPLIKMLKVGFDIRSAISTLKETF
ncbi:hypothetical protein [uncultured Chryseobacterium sp.]|uniref:hypothetical protein n=1 Tax=uncultured Chryseobacterium sp. TaxID=259322 RepID=UPI00258FD8D5|nr:hypothetical protein [uncultured Chryseobacterium sp.]